MGKNKKQATWAEAKKRCSSTAERKQTEPYQEDSDDISDEDLSF